MSSITELNEITTESKKLQSEIIANIVRSKNSTTKLLPTKERAGDENLELEKYVQKYAVSLVNEESNFRDQYNSYKDSIKEKLESLYNLPSGTAFSEKAMKFAQEIEEGDEKVLENAINFEKHLQSRHESLTSLAVTEKVPQPSAHIYNIRGTKQTPLIKPNTQAAQVAQVVQPAKTTVATTVTSAPSYNILNKRHMDLPIFYGDITEWPAFYMIFDALVAKDTECPNVMKHNILRQHLRGAPYDLVKPYKADGTEFETALERLVKMYNADDIQYDYLWSRLINLPRAKENPENMRHIHNEMNAIINSLKSHGSIETQNFQSVIKTKIPRATLLEILKMKPENTTGILNAFDDIISIEEMAQRSHNTSYKEERSIFTVKKTNSQRNCKFCSRNNHASYECKTVATLNDRRDYVKNKQLCYNCMNSGHTSRECRSPKCRKCDKKHNSALCPKNQNTTHSSQHNAYNERKQQTENQNWKTYKNDNSNNFRKPNEGQQQQQQKYQSNQKQWNQGQGNQQNGQKSSGQSGYNNQKYQNKGHSGPPKFNNPQKAKGFQVSTNHTSLMIANAPVLINDDIETIPILLDSGADQSFILSEYAGEKNMKIIEENIELDLSVFGKNNSTIISNKVEFEILTNSDNDSAIRVEALTVPKITDLFDPIDLSEEERRFLTERNQKTVNITKPTTPVALIGCDIFWNLMADEKIEKLPSGRFIVPTHLGSIICGKNTNSPTSTHALISRISKKDKNFTETSLEEYFELSNIGITGEPNDPTHEEIKEEFMKTATINEDTKKIVVSLPWKTGQRDCLDDNKSVAFCRLKQLYNSTHTKEAWQNVIENFESMEKSKIIEQVDNETNDGFYIPYGLVFNNSSNTTKVRTVFDASSKRRGELSLNNALHQGPSLVPEIQAILLRIRQGKYIISGDIEKAFHAVEVKESDRDALRFLWLIDPNKPPSNDNIRYMRFTRLPFGVNCSPYLLSMAILYGIQTSDVSDELAQAIEKMCYVDNLFMQTDEIDKIMPLYNSSKEFFENIGMNIREFSINCTEKHDIENMIPEKDRAKNLDNVKILGYLYDLFEDTMQVKQHELQYSENEIPKLNKRQVVSEITKVFDPLQYFAPLYLEGKIILRELSDHTIKWTDLAKEGTVRRMFHYRKRIDSTILKFKRHIDFKRDEDVEIAVFTDASEIAYGACLYLKTKIKDKKGQFNTHLLIAKQRIAPKSNPLTIPKLELLGILIGIRLLKYVLREMKLNAKNIDIFSDSTIALAQIKNQSSTKAEKQPIFVENRTREIWNTLLDLKKEDESRNINLAHVFTDQNPADHITRGCNSIEELVMTNWPNGNEWLSDNNHKDHPYQISDDNKIIVPVPLDDIPVNEKSSTATALVVKNKKQTILENEILPLARINDLDITTRITAFVLRFIKHKVYDKLSKETKVKLDTKIPELQRIPECSGEITVDEMKISTNLMIRLNQQAYSITAKPKQNQFLLESEKPDLIVYQHHRAHNITNKPIIHTKSELARQIIRKVHSENLHAGPATTLGIILESYAGTKWRTAVKKELKRCYKCRRSNNHSFRLANPGYIPERRTTECVAFNHAGVDFLGPIITQRNSSAEQEKAYIALFTCATTRLVHLELVRNLSTDEFLLALSRFMNRRGYPETITSDNAATFKLTSEILEKYSTKCNEDLLELPLKKITNYQEKDQFRKTKEIEREMTRKGVTWYFNTALAPWQGGFFERLVGLVKKALKHALGDEKYITKDLETVMIECESIVNRRPITYIDEDNEDVKLLRPIDLITPQIQFPSFDEDGLNDEYAVYTTNFRNVKEHVKRFWQVFHRDYLNQNKNFRSIQQTNRAFSNLVKPIVGEVVLLKDDKTPRQKWKTGIITELIEGRDGEIRSVRVRTTLKKKKRNSDPTYKQERIQIITRPLQLVIPLEIRPQTETEEVEKVGNKVDSSARKAKINMAQSRLNRVPLSWYKLIVMSILVLFMLAFTPVGANKLDRHAVNYTTNPIITSTTEIPSTVPTQITTTKRKAPKTTTTTPPTTTSTTTQVITTTTVRSTIRTTQSTTSQTVAPPPTTTRRTTTQTTTTQTVPTTTMQTIAPTPLTTRRTTATPTTTQTVPTTTTTEYYSPYTPQWRTPHTTAEWQYASTTPWYTPWTYPPYPTTTPYRYPTQDPSRYTSQHDYLNDYHAGLQRRVHANYPRQEGQRRSVTTTEPRMTTTEPRTTTPTTTPKMETIQFFEAHESKSRIECTNKGANLVEEDEIANNTNTVCTENWCDHELTVSHNFRKCQKGPIMYTKNVTVHADSSKRCHGMGECVDRKCLDDTLTAQAAAEEYGANAYFQQKHAYFIGHMQYLPLTTSSKYIVVNHGPML
ncbi:hypothetical protein B9Z55_007041 [Caenorhabditis nigoni]|uniref:Uncharacterized protein n=1 Tax=Caenorhabditis nigoni TaxID=1611254 RepID=A0A2G5V7Q9_9PELO|nr:hypothetical protein B9Z55_007041 [Caenorhabditis nigoni]